MLAACAGARVAGVAVSRGGAPVVIAPGSRRVRRTSLTNLGVVIVCDCLFLDGSFAYLEFILTSGIRARFRDGYSLDLEVEKSGVGEVGKFAWRHGAYSESTRSRRGLRS